MKRVKADMPRVARALALASEAFRPGSSVPSRCWLLWVVLLVALPALAVVACGHDTATSAAGSPSASATSSRPGAPASVTSPRPALSQWSPGTLRAALPGLLVARARHPRLEVVSPDAARTIKLWTPPAGYGVGLLDCDPIQGRALVRVWDRRVGLDEGTLVLLAEDGTARRLDLPEKQRLEAAVLLADGSVVCSTADNESAHPTQLQWSDGNGDWQPVHITGHLLKAAEQNGIVSLEPMAGRRAVLLKTWAWGGAVLPATWDGGTLTASGKPVRTGWLSGAPLASKDTVLMAQAYARQDRLAVDLVRVQWAGGEVQKRVVVKDGPQSSGHDAITLVGAGPDRSALVLGWRLDGESAPTEKDDARAHHLQHLDLDAGKLAVLPLKVSSSDGWSWLASSPASPPPVRPNDLVFVRSNHVWRVRAEGGTPVQITAGPGSDSAPTWSPDHTQIAYVHVDDPDSPGPSKICVIPAAGVSVRSWTIARNVPSLCFSPDGEHIAFADLQFPDPDSSATRLKEHVAILDLATGEAPVVRTLHDQFTTGMTVSWSPDGTRLLLAVSRQDGEGQRAGILTLARDKLSWLPTADAFDAHWSANGHSMVVSQGTQSYTRVSTAGAAGAITRVLARGGGFLSGAANVYDGCFSPDGSRVAYLRKGAIWTVGLDGSGARRLVMHGGQVAWAPR